MVKLKKATYERILKQTLRWGYVVSSEDTCGYGRGVCDICLTSTRAQLQMQENDPDAFIAKDDPGWVICLYHAREMGLAW